MHRRRLACPYAGCGSSLYRRFLAHRRVRAPAVEIRKNDLENVGTALQARATALGSVQPLARPSNQLLQRFEAVKNASGRVGGQLGRRDLGNPFVLVHRLFGALQQLVDSDGPLRIEVCDTDAQ